MAMTPILQRAHDYLKEVGRVVRIKEYNSTPHDFTGPDERVLVEGGRLLQPTWDRTINRQSLNKLIALGYAEYTDKQKNEARFIDKQAADAKLHEEAEIGRLLLRAVRREIPFVSDSGGRLHRVTDVDLKRLMTLRIE